MYKDLKHIKLGDMNFYNGDNMDLLKQTPDKFYDIAIVDPPYGIGADVLQNKAAQSRIDSNGTSKAGRGWVLYEKSDWDNEIPSEDYFKELKRVSKNQIIWGGNYFTEFLDPSQCWLIWDKKQREFSLADGEMAWTSYKKSMRIFDFSRASALKNNNDNGGRFHPTQKPVALYEWILNNYAKPNDKILDTHLGSGSIALACHKLNFSLTAIELDEGYFNKAIERIEKVTKFKTNNNLF